MKAFPFSVNRTANWFLKRFCRLLAINSPVRSGFAELCCSSFENRPSQREANYIKARGILASAFRQMPAYPLSDLRWRKCCGKVFAHIGLRQSVKIRRHG